MCVCVCVCVKKERYLLQEIASCLLWRLTSSMICSWQAEDLGRADVLLSYKQIQHMTGYLLTLQFGNAQRVMNKPVSINKWINTE